MFLSISAYSVGQSRKRISGSGQEIPDHVLILDPGEPLVEPLELVGELCVIDAEAVQGGGVSVTVAYLSRSITSTSTMSIPERVLEIVLEKGNSRVSTVNAGKESARKTPGKQRENSNLPVHRNSEHPSSKRDVVGSSPAGRTGNSQLKRTNPSGRTANNQRTYFLSKSKSTTQQPLTCSPGSRQWFRISALSHPAS
jgi:hypothetical protein